jgi:hypothetical protein
MRNFTGFSDFLQNGELSDLEPRWTEHKIVQMADSATGPSDIDTGAMAKVFRHS